MYTFKKLKEGYLSVRPSLRLKERGWDELLKEIDKDSPPIRGIVMKPWYYRVFTVSFLVVIFAITAGVVKASLPGTPLYPVKILSEKIIETATGDNSPAIDNRAREIKVLIQQRDDNREQLEETVVEYKREVDKAKERSETKEDEEELKQKIGEKHSEIEEAVRKLPEVEKEVEDVVNELDDETIIEDWNKREEESKEGRERDGRETEERNSED